MDVPLSTTFVVVGILLLVVLSAMFSAAETAIQSLSAARVRFLAEQKGTAKLLKLWPKNRLHVLTTILIGNNLVNISATALATDLVQTEIGGGWALSLAIGVMTFLILTFGEIVPKSYAIGSAEAYVKWVLPLLTPFYWVSVPFTLIMTKLTRVVIGAFGGSPIFKTHPLTEEEFRFLLAQGSNLDARKGEMLSSIFEFHDTMVKEIMIPRTDAKALDVDADNAQLLKAIADDMFSRYPVYEDNIDNIIGVFNVKDLLQYLNEHELDSFKLRKFLRRPYFVPETKKISELFRELQRRKFHIAIAVDEFGGTAGIVTMEDIIEEIFGEIYDEFDEQEVQIKKLADGRYLADARIPIRDLVEVISVDIPADGDYETLGGFLMCSAGRVPELNSKIEWNGLTFTIKDADNKSIHQVEIDKRAHVAPPEQ